MKVRATPKLDAARVAVGAVLAMAETRGWSQRRLRADLRAALASCPVSRTTWRTAVILLTGRGLRKLPDPRHAQLARMREGRAA